MALFQGKQEYIALDANNITLVFDSGNIVDISGNIFLYPPQGHPILYKYDIHIKIYQYILVLDTNNKNIQNLLLYITYVVAFIATRGQHKDKTYNMIIQK